MELTTKELEGLLGVSYVMVASYAKDGRLERTRKGFYKASGMARFWDGYPGADEPYTSDREEAKEIREACRELWRVQQKHKFKRMMRDVIKFRTRPPARNLTAEQNAEIAEAMNQFMERLTD